MSAGGAKQDAKDIITMFGFGLLGITIVLGLWVWVRLAAEFLAWVVT